MMTTDLRIRYLSLLCTVFGLLLNPGLAAFLIAPIFTRLLRFFPEE
jgi:hypothetical protein